ncbi:MAG: ABC transporter ATP-binding protein [Acidobacteriota bacterium]|nr:ABC transporter ATP-binding protein [Acidobacteriota bacterium]
MSTDSLPPAFATSRLERRYRLGEAWVPALRGVDLAIGRGELVTVAGPSGSGKSTLLHLLGGLDEPDAGQVFVDGTDLATLGERERTLLRRRRLGFVFQTFNLVPVLSALENVEYPLLLDGRPAGERRDRAAEALAAVGLAARSGHRPDQLSGGERQRVAIARAVVHAPLALLADEPTGNLDSATAAGILDLLLALRRERGTTIVIATHDPALVARSPRRLVLRDGRIESDSAGEAPR